MKTVTRLQQLCVVAASILLGPGATADLSEPEFNMNIPQQRMDYALQELAQVTGLQVLFRAEVERVSAPRLAGTYTSREALDQLLANTELKYEFVNERTVFIQREHPPSRNIAKPFTVAEAPQVPEEITVTATKRQVGLQKLPQAVTALTARRLDELNSRSVQDYLRAISGVMLHVDDKGRLDFSIRGVSDFSLLIPQTVATVAQYVDEIPLTSTGAQIDMRLVDIERIEVLRGPQGTYYGEGSLGGTVRIITRKPELTRFAAHVESRLSSTDSGGIDDQEAVTLNIPILEDRFALRANYTSAADSGYLDFVTTNRDRTITGVVRNDANSHRMNSGRLMALLAPTRAVTVLAEALTTESHTGASSVYDPGLGDLRTGFICPASFEAASECSSYRVSQRADAYNLTVNAEMDQAALVSASSWSQTEFQRTLFAVQPSAKTGVLNTYSEQTRAFTQELRLVSPEDWLAGWSYVAGAFYTHKRSSRLGQYDIGPTAPPAGQIDREAALFGELGYRFDARWAARLGMRYSSLQQDLRIATPGDGAVRLASVHKKYRPLTGRAALDYSFNDRALLYVSVANGFRKGGANPQIEPSAEFDVPLFYEPDAAINYELGWKLAWPARRAALNGAVYHIDWNNVQSMALMSDAASALSIPYLRNAGDVVVDGVDLEGGLELMQGLTINGSVAFIAARLARDSIAVEEPLAFNGRKGDRVPFVAPLSGSLSMSYRRSLRTNGWEGFAVLNGQYQGRRYSDYRAEVDDSQPSVYATMSSYWLMGAQLGVENRRWRAALYGENLLDERAELMRAPDNRNPHSDRFRQITCRPRTVGVSFRYSFN